MDRQYSPYHIDNFCFGNNICALVAAKRTKYLFSYPVSTVRLFLVKDMFYVSVAYADVRRIGALHMGRRRPWAPSNVSTSVSRDVIRTQLKIRGRMTRVGMAYRPSLVWEWYTQANYLV